ncbi:MAG: preprotein translocase subunit SecE [Candidatus Saccharibacteria bacterium]|nr:preprotein translocase subunit SecE [Candidatus Saccharibacteria bacterium]
MANITRIKAKDPNAKQASDDQPQKVITPVKAHINTKPEKSKDKKVKSKKTHRPLPKPLRIITAPFRLLFRPFVHLGSYLHHSWLEIRQVRWPNRSTTWKMFSAVLIYTVIFVVLTTALDAFFTFIFNQLLK